MPAGSQLCTACISYLKILTCTVLSVHERSHPPSVFVLPQSQRPETTPTPRRWMELTPSLLRAGLSCEYHSIKGQERKSVLHTAYPHASAQTDGKNLMLLSRCRCCSSSSSSSSPAAHSKYKQVRRVSFSLEHTQCRPEAELTSYTRAKCSSKCSSKYSGDAR